MGEFRLYFELGMEHILDPRGYDHIMFVIALCTVFVFGDWKKVLILVTAFTIGHSITLGLATLNVIRVNTALIEFLIPVTILLTAVSNIFSRTNTIRRSKIQTNYILALFFGFIHGMGFSNYLQALLGKDESIFTQLFAFNIGLEAGQIIVVSFFLLITFIFIDIFRISRRDWRLVISSAIIGIAFTMMADNKFW